MLLHNCDDFHKQEYSSGTNLIVNLGKARKMIGVSSHFDRVPNLSGAYDNVLQVLFFDEEEAGLRGSTAYIKEGGVNS